MADLENAINALEAALVQMHGCGRYTPEDVDDLEKAAWDVLKSLEPRVLTLREWICSPEPAAGESMCYEIKNKGLQSMLVKAFDGTRHLYGKAFRVWTSRPTEEQRKAVKWDE